MSADVLAEGEEAPPRVEEGGGVARPGALEQVLLPAHAAGQLEEDLRRKAGALRHRLHLVEEGLDALPAAQPAGAGDEHPPAGGGLGRRVGERHPHAVGGVLADLEGAEFRQA